MERQHPARDASPVPRLIREAAPALVNGEGVHPALPDTVELLQGVGLPQLEIHLRGPARARRAQSSGSAA